MSYVDTLCQGNTYLSRMKYLLVHQVHRHNRLAVLNHRDRKNNRTRRGHNARRGLKLSDKKNIQ